MQPHQMIQTKGTEKLRNYKDLENEVSRMWKMKTKIVPVIIGALEIIKMALGQILQLMPGQPSVTELLKITLMSTANIIRKVLG